MQIKFAFDLSRIWEHSVKDKKFGLVSAYKSELTEAENEERAKLMKKAVRELGYGYKEIYGVWESKDGTITIEYPLFIPNLSRKDAIFLGRDAYLPEDKRHPQETVIVGDGTEILLIRVDTDEIDATWAQIEVGWREMWEGTTGTGWSEYKGKEWRWSSVTWGIRDMPDTPSSWLGHFAFEAYVNGTGTFEFNRERIKQMYIKTYRRNI